MPVGEDRIPRRAQPEYTEIKGGVVAGIFQHGWKIWKVALDDTNQYGPHAMIVILVISATVTGAALQIVGTLL
jgi:hypothetical protein